MAVDIQRRMAFANAFRQFPDIIEQFARNNVSLVDPETTREYKPEQGPGEQVIMSILMAQFVTRLIRTRAVNSTFEMEEFSRQAVARYAAFNKTALGELVMTSPGQYLQALTHIQSNISAMIFEALGVEAEDPRFVEVDFWRDVFLALAHYRGSGQPNWLKALHPIVLDHMPAFKEALEAEPPERASGEVNVVPLRPEREHDNADGPTHH